MHILVLSDNFVPEVRAPSFRIMDHAREWLKLGHEVTVVTCVPNAPYGKVFPGYRNRLYQEEYIEGVRVLRVWSYMVPNFGTMKRVLDYISFTLTAIAQCWRYPKFDIILATSPPLFVPVAGYVISKLRRRPWIFELRDLWPASVRAVGASQSRLLKPFEMLELFLYRRARRIISVTSAFKDDLVARGIRPDKIDVVTNGVDTSVFNRGSIRFNAREKLGIGREAFLAGYIGTVGMAHGLETILDAAELCRDETDLYFLVMGEGAERAPLEEEARRRGLSRVIFHDFVPHEQIPSYLGSLDVSVVHLKPHPVFKTVIPSKIFESMAMGIPMVYAVEGVSAQIVAEAGAGVCIASGDPKAMADAVRELKGDREKLQQMGAQAQDVVSRQYSRRAMAEEMIRSFHATLGRAHDAVGKGTMAAGSGPEVAVTSSGEPLP